MRGQDEGFDLAQTLASITFTGQAHASLADESALEARLDTVFAGIERKDVVVCTSVAGEIAFAAVGPESALRHFDALVRPGCLTKLFTATLIGELIADGAFGLNDLAGTLISIPQSARECLDGITIRHLLEHTHGMDDSACVAAPLRPDDLIDSEALIRICSEFRLNRPGEIYSYSNAGPWIAGAILEAWHCRRYDEVLQSRLFDPLGITAECINGHDAKPPRAGICPATGGAMAVSARDFIRFMDAAGSRQELWPDTAVPAAITPLPGWNPFERGVYLGWKWYGDGWYGHNSIANNGSTVLARLHPEERVSVVVASAYQHADVVAAKLFGKSVPGFSTLSIPRLSSPGASESPRNKPYDGTYRNSVEVFSVTASDSWEIELDSPSGKSFLRPADENIFIANKADARGVKVVQFLCRQGESFRYLWDGRRLYRNINGNNHA